RRPRPPLASLRSAAPVLAGAITTLRRGQHCTPIRGQSSTPIDMRGALLPLLRPRENDEHGRPRPLPEEALKFRLLLRDLHAHLESYQLEVYRDDVLERISFRSVCLANGVNLPRRREFNRHNYEVNKANGRWVSAVVHIASGQQRCRIEQDAYNALNLQADPGYAALSEPQRAQLLNLYQEANPRPLKDLSAGQGAPIIAGDIEFRCTDEELFAGMIEVLYAMRNAVLHGELQPEEDALACYEPAYRIIQRMLDCLV
ncbi:hypothetical protein, partial [Hyphomicrobium sp. NDB2Meth4]|uniref:hypothetical protein n=1 Tax=Hyphomicrobium sp. NDB2Meth4 TaxID=1892846 RepID=UPI000A59137C